MADKRYREGHPEKVRAQHKQYYDKPKEGARAYAEHWRELNPEKHRAYQKRYREKYPEKVRARKRRWREKHAEKVQAYNKQYYKEHDEEILANTKRYRGEHSEGARACCRRWKERHPDYQRQWLKKNPHYRKQWRKENLNYQDKERLYNTRHYHKKLSLPCTLTIQECNNIKAQFNYSCAYCGKIHTRFQQEHIIPVDNNGSYSRGNIIPTCPKSEGNGCNQSKRNKFLLEWYPKQPFFNTDRLLAIYNEMVEHPLPETQHLVDTINQSYCKIFRD
jgi:hypothetical protein